MNTDPLRIGRRRLLAAGCGCLLPLGAGARAPSAMHGAGHNPYAGLSSGACTGGGLACASAVTPCFAPDGTLWVAWTSNGAVGVSRSEDLARRFTGDTVIARHDAYLDTGPDARPQIVVDAQGRLIVAYAFFHDDHWNARVHVATSSDNGATFTAPRPVCTDPASQRFPVLALAPSGRVFAAWVDKRLVAADARAGRARAGASIAYAWSGDGGRTFGPNRIAYADSCECCRIGVAMGNDGLPTLVFRALYPGSVRDHASLMFRDEQTPGSARRIANDDWVTEACPHHGPATALSAQGTLHAAWYTRGRNRQGVFYAYSRDGGIRMSAPMRVGDPDRMAGRPALLCLGETTWLAWKEFDGRQASVWLRRSRDDGTTWTPPAQVAAAAGYTDHPLLVAGRNHAYLSWLTRSRGYQLIDLAALA